MVRSGKVIETVDSRMLVVVKVERRRVDDDVREEFNVDETVGRTKNWLETL